MSTFKPSPLRRDEVVNSDGEIKRIKNKSPFTGNGFLFIDQEALSRLSTLTSEAIKVMLPILSNLDRDNHCKVSQSAIAIDIQMKPSNVSRSIKLLSEHGLVIKQGRRLLVDPHFCWKGSVERHKKAIKEYNKAKMESVSAYT